VLQSLRCCRAALCLLGILAWGAPASAVQPSETLLPASAKGFLSVANVDAFKAAWDKTQVGQLMNDPKMQPFVEDFRAQIKSKWLSTHQSLGLSMDDLEGVPGGELTFSMIQPAPGKYAIVITVDTTGHDKQAQDLINKVTTNLTNLKATKVATKAKEITAFQLPPNDKLDQEKNHQAAFFHVNNMLVFSDSIAEVEAIFPRLGKTEKTTLANVEAFTSVMKRVQTAELGKLGKVDLAPHARWFVEPFGYIEASRATKPPKKFDRNHQDMVKILKLEGFDCVQGIGGYVNFMTELSTGKYDIFHRTAVYAPPGPNGYKRGARMLKFPNGGELVPQPWVPRELATYTTFNLDVKNAFEMSKTLINRIAGDDVFEDVLDGLKNDENGPQIDIRKDLIANLGNRVTILGDYQLPITTKSERVLFALEIKQTEKDVAELIKRSMKDQKHRVLKFGEHTIFEVINEPEAKAKTADELIEITGIDEQEVAAPKKKPKEDEEEKNSIPNSAICVANGLLFVGTHVDIVKKIVKNSDDARQGAIANLGQSADFQLALDHLKKLGANGHCATIFSRTDEEYRTTYEMLRQNKMPQAETMLAKLLNAMLEQNGQTRQQKIHGEKLPEYDVARRYLGPAGAYVVSEPNGWLIVGFMLAKEAPAAEVVRADSAAAETK